jgi:hypothetical protein
MLDQLLAGVKDQAIGSLTQNGLSADQAAEAFPIATEGVASGIMGAVTGGNGDGIASMLSSVMGGGGASMTSNPMFQSILGSVAGNLTSKLGIGSSTANTAIGALLPMLLSKVGGAAAANGDTDGIGVDDLMALAGGGGGGMLGKAAGMLGGMFGK